MAKKQSKPALERVLRCCVCNKPVMGFYARWGKTGSCSRICDGIKAKEVADRIEAYHSL